MNLSTSSISTTSLPLTTTPTTTLSQLQKIMLEDGTRFDDPFVTAIKAGIYCFIFIIGLFGNVLVVKATKQYMTLQGATNILICNLCICDVVMLVLGLPAFVIGEHRLKDWFGTTACKIINPLAITIITATVYTLVAIAVERYNVIVNSRRFKVNLTSRRTYYAIVIIDFLAIASSVPLAKIDYKSNSVHCVRAWDVRDHSVYTITLFIFQYVFPLVVMVILYGLCWHRIRKKNKATIKLANRNRRTTKRSQSDDNILSLASGQDNKQDQPNDIISKTRPVSGDFLHNNNNNEINDFLSGSQNHLSGVRRHSWQRTAVMRRSFSVDSVMLDSSESIENDNKNKSRRGSGCRKSATYDAQLSVAGMLSGDSENDDESLSRRRSFVGSVQRLHASFTSLIIGADGQDALTAFAMKRVKQTLKTLRMFSFLVLVFAVCFLPHHVNSFIFEDVAETIRFMEILIYISAAINPWIYAGMNKSYRVAFAGFFQNQQHRRRNNGRRRNNKFNRQRNRAVYNRNGRRLNNHINKFNDKNILEDTTSTMCSTSDSSLVKLITWLCYKFSSSKGQYNIEPCHYESIQAVRQTGSDSANPSDKSELLNNNVVEERDTIADLDQLDQFGFSRTDSVNTVGYRANSFNKVNGITFRKDSKMSRKASNNSTTTTDTVAAHHHIPVLAPIIIVTNYDEELALQRALEKAREEVDGDVDEDRFSAIISFNDA